MSGAGIIPWNPSLAASFLHHLNLRQEIKENSRKTKPKECCRSNRDARRKTTWSSGAGATSGQVEHDFDGACLSRASCTVKGGCDVLRGEAKAVGDERHHIHLLAGHQVQAEWVLHSNKTTIRVGPLDNTCLLARRQLLTSTFSKASCTQEKTCAMPSEKSPLVPCWHVALVHHATCYEPIPMMLRFGMYWGEARVEVRAHRVGIAEGSHEVNLLAVDGGEGQVRMIAAHPHRDHLASRDDRVNGRLKGVNYSVGQEQQQPHQEILMCRHIKSRLPNVACILTPTCSSSLFAAVEEKFAEC